MPITPFFIANPFKYKIAIGCMLIAPAVVMPWRIFSYSFILLLVFKIVRLITFGKIKVADEVLMPVTRAVADLTFRDMVTWYIEKEYKPAGQVRYELKS